MSTLATLSSHHGRTAAPGWSLPKALRAQLDALDDNSRALLALRRWAATEPVLAGLDTFDAVRRLVHHDGDAERVDQVLQALARLASLYGAGDALAAQVLLALMATGMAAWRRRLAYLAPDACGAEEIEQALAAELAVRIRTWRGKHRVAANLLRSSVRDVRGRLQRDQRPGGMTPAHLSLDQTRNVATDPNGEMSGLRVVPDLSTRSEDPEGEAEVNDLFDWVVKTGLLSADDVELVRARRVLGFGDDELARARGVQVKTLQRRAQRIEARLVDAVHTWSHAS